uniref:Si:ch73-173p19.1 n=1 Tax=Hippocampus comes TaxID=109280 RepID=A0A3Q2YGA6_HIPCM
MGFTQEQIQAAVQAGHFSVMDAAEWLLQGHQHPRHSLLKQQTGPAETAFAAFNPPKESTSASESYASAADFGSLVLRPAQKSSPPSRELHPVESRIKQDKSDFEEQQRQRVAQEARAERRQKKQERELVLKRIADDRRSLQEKKSGQFGAAAAGAASPSNGNQGHAQGGKVQSNADNNCILMIRLPSGESIRERFPADAPLRSVVEHITGCHPSLPAFSLLQGFPRKRFGEAELSCSLRSLGLTPNAALCIQTTPPETPQDPSGPAQPPPVECDRQVCPTPQAPAVQERAGRPDLSIPSLLPNHVWEEAASLAGIAGSAPLHGPSHFWGRGQKLVAGNPEEAADVQIDQAEEEEEDDDDDDEEEEGGGEEGLPLFLENRNRSGFVSRHRWPEQGNRLREAPADEPAPEPDDAEGRAAHGAAGQAAVERLLRVARRQDAGQAAQAAQGQPLPAKRSFKTPSVSSLCALATRATVHLMTAPSMQYSSSLAGLTPELAELLLSHMAQERLLRPRNLELFFGCPLQKFVLNCYPYSTNELLRQLRAFTALKHLSLVNSPLITAPPCLSQLSLNQTAVGEAALAALPAGVPQLRMLSIKQTKVDPIYIFFVQLLLVSDVSALSELPGLQTLNLDGTNVTEASLAQLGAHPSLSSLSLAGIRVSDGDRALHIISGLPLTHLTLPGRHSVTDSGLAFLSQLWLLAELDLTDYKQVTDQGVQHLCSMTRLKKLSLSNTQVTDIGLTSLRPLLELQELCLDRTAVSSRGAAALITCLPHLQVLGLASTHVGDNVVRRGLIHCPQLVKCNLSRTRITDKSVKFLARMRLTQVNLDGTGVSLAGVAGLLACAHISSIRASNTRVVPIDDVSDDDGEALL